MLTIDGWYNCSEETYYEQKTVSTECAKYQLPFCHSGVCTNTIQSIPVFVKRIPATNPTSPPRTLWMMQDDIGSSSIEMEELMVHMFQLYNKQVTIMTMDQRGSGRSNRLDCKASQTSTKGSPGGRSVTLQELPSCLRDLQQIYGSTNLAAFSLTSAAMDLLLIINTDPTSEVYFYGSGYGTLWLQRFMLMTPMPSNVKGFILDGAIQHSGPNTATYSSRDITTHQVATQFLQLCDADSYCRAKYPGTTAIATATTLFEQLRAGTSPCSNLVTTLFGDSSGLKSTLALFLQSNSLRPFIPPLIYRFSRCLDTDRNVLNVFMTGIVQWLRAPVVGDILDSILLHDLITYSENWETPSPSLEVLQTRFDSSLLAIDGMTAKLSFYCIYTGVHDPACLNTDKLYNYDRIAAFTYTRDSYFNQTISLPSTISIVFLHGGLDSVASIDAAKSAADGIHGAQKQFLTFPTCPHGIASKCFASGQTQHTCGQMILASFVASGGNLSLLNASCRSSIPPVSFDISSAFSNALVPGLYDFYDGTIPSTLPPTTTTALQVHTSVVASSASSALSFAIVTSVLGALTIAMVVLVIKLRRLTRSYITFVESMRSLLLIALPFFFFSIDAKSRGNVGAGCVSMIDCAGGLACLQGDCKLCTDDIDCDVNRHCITRRNTTICVDKDVFSPFMSYDLVTAILAVAATALGSACGLGSGGLLVPIYIVVLGLSPKYAIPLSKATIFGGAASTFWFNFRAKHPYAKHRPLINYSLAALMEPPTLLGTIVGVMLNTAFPSWLLLVLLILLLFVVTQRTLKRARKLYWRETSGGGLVSKLDDSSLTKTVESKDEIAQNEIECSLGLDADTSRLMREDIIETESVVFPFRKFVLPLLMSIVVVLGQAYFRGGTASSIIVTCGSLGYWLLLVPPTVYLIYLTRNMGNVLLLRCFMGEKCGMERVEGDIQWTPLLVQLIFPMNCFLAGIASALLGIGAGQFPGSFQYDYVMWYGLLGFIGGVLGKTIVDTLIRRSGRMSLVLYFLGINGIFQSIAMGYIGVQTIIHDTQSGGFAGFSSICGV